MPPSDPSSLTNKRMEPYGGSKPPRIDNYSRRDKISNLHIYWSKKPYELIQKYIQAFSKENDVIFDPFCGSGTTAVAALSSGRKFIGGDLSKAATFITKNTLLRVKVKRLEDMFASVKKTVEKKINSLYATSCRHCEKEARVNYLRWCGIYECNCGEIVPLVEAKKEKRKYLCPACEAPLSLSYSTKRGEKLIGVHYSCVSCGNRNESVAPDQYDVNLSRALDAKSLDSPDDPRASEKLIQNSQIGITSPRTFLPEMYTSRNWFALRLLYDAIQQVPQEPAREQLLFVFTSVLYNASKMAQDNPKGGGIAIKGTLYRPPFFRERNVWRAFEYKFSRHLLPGKRAIQDLLALNGGDAPYVVFNRDARDYACLPDACIDYVFTDPPYGASVPYLELNAIMTHWLPGKDDYAAEIVISNSAEREKNLSEWQAGISRAFSEIFRVLKPGRWLTATFNRKDRAIWQDFNEIIHEIGFRGGQDEKAFDGLHVTYKQLVSTASVSGNEILINYYKPK